MFGMNTVFAVQSLMGINALLHCMCVFPYPDTGIQLQEEGEWSLCTRHHVIQDVVQRSEAFTINCRN